MQKEYQVRGMMCEGCSGAVCRMVSAIPGVAQAQVSLADKCLTVTFDPNLVTPEHIAKVIGDAGYEMIL